MSKDNNEIAIQPRSESGNNAARRARKTGLVPAVIYGKGMEPRSIYLNAGDWASIARHHHHILYLTEGDARQAVLVKEVQINHLKNYYLHVDFQAVAADEVIHSTVAIHPIGDSVGAAHGGVFEQLVHEIAVACHPGELIDEIKVDVSALDIGDSLYVRELQVPAGVTVTTDADAAVFHVAQPSKEEEPAPAAAPAADAAAAPEATKEKKSAE